MFSVVYGLSRLRQEASPNNSNARSALSRYCCSPWWIVAYCKGGTSVSFGRKLFTDSVVVQVVELLFARGLVKVLFATETFAMV